MLRLMKPLMLSLFAFSALNQTLLFGLNGVQITGWGPRNEVMAGANGAAPVDVSTVTVNPAGLINLSSRADLGAGLVKLSLWANPKHATGPAVNTHTGKQNGLLDYYVQPFAGIIYNSECSKWAFGASSVALASGGVTYKKPIIKPELLLTPNGQTVAQTGALFDTSASAYILQTAFAAAYQWSDSLSLGAAFDIDTFLFSADAPISTPQGLKQTHGRGRLDVTYGFGLTLGALYTINDQWAAGLTVITPQWFEQNKLYADLIPKFRLPPEVRLGFAYRPYCPLLLTFDVLWIGWNQVKPFKTTPAKGGFGWTDQFTFGLGLQYDINSSWIMRAGYNYGKTPIKSKVIFANALFPTHAEHTLSGGLEFFLNRQNSVALGVIYEIRSILKDNGQGDQISKLGKGFKSSAQATTFSGCWSLLF